MRIRNRCDNDCYGDCRRCERDGYIRSRNESALTDNGSNLEDIRKLGEYLSERYTVDSLIDEIRRVYDPNYLAFFGIPGAMESYLTHFKDNLGLCIKREDIRMLARAIVERGDMRF